MTEAKVTPEIIKYLSKNWKYSESAGIEIKIVKHPAKSMAFSAVAPHQYRATKMCEKRFIWKIPDLGVRNPFDVMLINEGMGVIAIIWYVPRKLKRLTLMFVNDLLDYKKTCLKNYITMEQAESIAFDTVDLTKKLERGMV